MRRMQSANGVQRSTAVLFVNLVGLEILEGGMRVSGCQEDDGVR